MTWAIDVVLAVMAAEALVLLALRRPVTRSRVLDVACALVPGALIVLALRVAVADGAFTAVALLLAAALPVHLADLRRRGLL
jgi:hypothetical protein